MVSNVDGMTAAVAADPADVTAQLVLADAITERTGDYPAAVAAAKLVALEVRITAFVAHLDATMAKHWADSGYTFSRPPTHRADYISGKWCRVVSLENWHDGQQRVGSVVAFVCLADGFTRTLGVLRAGDIHKPASFKAAAKHARGTVLADDFGKAVGAHGGVNYLR